MSEIDTSLVDAAAQDIKRIPPARVAREMERALREQPELLGFVLGCTDGMSPGVSELAGFIYLVIWRAFRDNTRGRMKAVTAGALQRKLEENEQALEKLGGDDPDSIGEGTLARLTPQPALFSYALHEMTLAQDEAVEPLTISPEESGQLILIFKTVIDSLDQASERVA